MRKAYLGVVLAAALALGACDQYNDERGRGDSPVGERIEEPRTVIFNVDRFPNFSIICDGTTAIYSHTREASQGPVVPNSVHCTEKDGLG